MAKLKGMSEYKDKKLAETIILVSDNQTEGPAHKIVLIAIAGIPFF